jgi:hypothetical protein
MNVRSEKIKDLNCPRAEITEYLDGELAPDAELGLELHFADCGICAEELNSQKKVSATLEILLENENKNIKLPKNFTKVITANAESNLDGLRSPKERSRALFICAILVLLGLFGFGTESKPMLFAVEKFTDQFLAVGGFIMHLFYTLSLGISAIFGSLCHKFIFSSTLTLLLIVTAFVIGSMILSRMVFRYNRS